MDYELSSAPSDVLDQIHEERAMRMFHRQRRAPGDPDYMERPVFSDPAEVCEPVEKVDATIARFSRTLDERSPHTRSSMVQIVPMASEQMHQADRIVVIACLIAAVTMVVAMVLQEVLP